MRRYSITQALNLPEYKITEIVSETPDEIDIRLRAYKGTVAKYIKTVIPAEAGIHNSIEIKAFWIPAFAGMTKNDISQQSHIFLIGLRKKSARLSQRDLITKSNGLNGWLTDIKIFIILG